MLSTGSKITLNKALIFSLVLGVLLISMKLQFTLAQKIPYNEANKTFVINKGDSLYKVLARLEESHGIEGTSWLKLKYIFRDSPVIKAGRYTIYRDSKLDSLIDRFVIGDVEEFKFTIIEGTVAKNNLIKLEKLLLDNDLSFDIPERVINIFSSEGSVLPDTYFFSDEEDLVKVLEDSKISLVEHVEDLWERKPADNPLKNKDEALVLASIIEREALLNSEQTIIASVFLSRLRKGMKLQADPTSSYGYYKDYGERIGRAVLDDQNEFNTYVIKGLPPSPICFPSKGAIEAAITSSPGEYLYFVAKGDGSHIFSKTYEEHNKAVKKYIYPK